VISVEDALDALDLSRAEPGTGLLRALFGRFNARVPFETASKIERDAAVTDAEEKARRPELFWREHLESGTGGTCFARVAAFQAVLDGLGFSSRRILGRVEGDFDHAALLVDIAGRPWICDVGFPLPELLPAEPGEVETALGAVRLSQTPRGMRIDLGGVPEGPRQLELFFEEVSEADFAGRWRLTFRPGARFLSTVVLRLQHENRVVSFAGGEVRVDDLHSRLTVPLVAERAGRLSEIFGVDAGLLGRAFARAGDPRPPGLDARLTAYLETGHDAARAFSAIADPEGYRALLAGVADVSDPEATSGGWTIRLSAPSAGPPSAGELEERVTPDVPRRVLRVERRAGTTRAEAFFQAKRINGRTYLLRGVRLSGTREDLLRNDTLRGRLAGALAVDLLAWARTLSRTG